MWNKIYNSLFEGSMCGSGPVHFAVWSYVLSKQKPDFKTGEFYVSLNPTLMAAAIGKLTPEQVEGVIEELCSPDPKSQTKDHEGRRLIREGQFQYLVVNGRHYHDIESKSARREYMREYMRNRRKGINPKPGQTPKKAIAEACAKELAADTTALNYEPSPKEAIKPATKEEQAEWLKNFKKEAPGCFDKKLGEKLGPATPYSKPTIADYLGG